ncbi:hypothetical protein Anapl_01725 [Anas platyrhynchos]|uniref:Uncharacterized protein n=1 Tax=Anas platyrhynchos TaxID=8839 RepID=R0JZI2_ANAPL|nr:hypothetical protein Anapl_01725 [Anas platyrhynchos]
MAYVPLCPADSAAAPCQTRDLFQENLLVRQHKRHGCGECGHLAAHNPPISVCAHRALTSFQTEVGPRPDLLCPIFSSLFVQTTLCPLNLCLLTTSSGCLSLGAIW